MSWDAALQVRESIRSCTACPLRETARSPVPWSGRTPAQIMCLGMAPGYQEDKEGVPFVGPAGWELKLLLKKSGLNPSLMAYSNAALCYPGRKPRIKGKKGGGGDKEPSRQELAACSNNLLDQIDIIQPSYILLFGKVALRAFRPDLELSHMVGRPLYYTGRDGFGRSVEWGERRIILWTLYHPAAALRSPKYEAAILDQLAAFKKYRNDELWPDDCATCRQEVAHFDAWGYGRCERHAVDQLALFSAT